MVGSRLRALEDELLKQVGDDEEKVGGGRVALPQAILALYPVAWDPIQENGSFARVKNVLHPGTKGLREATNGQDPVKGGPSHGVESFSEVELKNHGWSFARVARANEVGCKNVVLADIPAGDEPSLIAMD